MEQTLELKRSTESFARRNSTTDSDSDYDDASDHDFDDRSFGTRTS
jgi:hypothetical protein